MLEQGSLWSSGLTSLHFRLVDLAGIGVSLADVTSGALGLVEHSRAVWTLEAWFLCLNLIFADFLFRDFLDLRKILSKNFFWCK